MVDILRKLEMYGVKRFTECAAREILTTVLNRWCRQSYSQLGEDLVMDRLLGRKARGFYIDIGANDPRRFSNTYRFYRRGWHGILIEPNTHLCRRLRECRPNDQVLNMGIAREPGGMEFWAFFPHTLSTFSEAQAQIYISENYKLVERVRVPTETLRNIFANYGSGNAVDILSIDTEGFDMVVLQSNDWNRYRPLLICVESATGVEARFLETVGYRKVYSNGLNAIYRDSLA